MSYSFQYTGDSLTVTSDVTGTPFHVQGSEAKFDSILTALHNRNWNTVTSLIDELKALRRFSGGKIKVVNGVLTFNGETLPPVLTQRLLTMYEQGVSLNRFENFLTKLRQNPSYSSQNELLLFLEGNQLVISEDGDFFAYKAVRSNYKDIHSGRFDNSPGKVLEMPRQDVDDNRNNTCSNGFHFSSLDYAKGFRSGNGRIVSLKINPANVVSIPIDYNNQKGRTCKYAVVADITDEVVTEGLDPLSRYTDQDTQQDPFMVLEFYDDAEDEFTVTDENGDEHDIEDPSDIWFYEQGYEWNGAEWEIVED